MSTTTRLGAVRFAIVALVLGCASRAAAQGCAMCGSSLKGDDPVSQAFNTSILFMIAVPYTLFTLAAVWLWVAYRRAQKSQRTSVIPFPVVPGASAPAGGPKEV